MNISIENIYPLIVPASYSVKGTWDLPHYNYTFSNQDFILTWVVFNSSTMMNYLMQQQYQELNDVYENWQQKSFENLRQSIADDENFFTQYKMSKNKNQLLWICFMHSDGIGSSRVLLSFELTKAFPKGYYLAFPDRSCGLIISKDINEEDLKEVKDLVKNMHKGTTTAMSRQLYSPQYFVLPETWTKPIDLIFSETLTNEVLKLNHTQ